MLIVIPSSVQILYLQETPILASPSVKPTATITSLAPGFTSANQYAWSGWFYKYAWTGNWERYFRITLDTSYYILLV